MSFQWNLKWFIFLMSVRRPFLRNFIIIGMVINDSFLNGFWILIFTLMFPLLYLLAICWNDEWDNYDSPCHPKRPSSHYMKNSFHTLLISVNLLNVILMFFITTQIIFIVWRCFQFSTSSMKDNVVTYLPNNLIHSIEI